MQERGIWETALRVAVEDGVFAYSFSSGFEQCIFLGMQTETFVDCPSKYPSALAHVPF